MERVKEFYLNSFIKEYSDLDYLLYKICYHGAPTILRLKPASLICFKNNKSIRLKDVWDEYRDELVDIIPCSHYELKRFDIGVNVLFYQEEWLKRLLKRNDVKGFLRSLGYGEYRNACEALDVLIARYKEECPHEIGVFLGYPLSDVMAFASDKKQSSIGVGYWRVYSNLKRSKQIFKLYDQARLEINNTLKSGIRPYQFLRAI